jgi:tetratricopeptide (TPR) repeat protein
MRKQLCLWLLGSATVFAPALAHAEDEPKPYPECTKAPSDAETAAAKGAYQAGNASFDEADYPRAITYWEDAYRRDCTANLLLKNLARAYELYGQKRQAVVALETFLVREPASGDKDQIQRRIEVLKKQIADEKAAPPAAATQPVAPVVPVANPATQPQSPSEAHNGKRSIVPLFVAGAGGVITVVGLAVFIPASSKVSDFEKQCPGHTCTPTGPMDNQAEKDAAQAAANKLAADAESARKKKIAGGVIIGVGAATLVGGLIWYFVQPSAAATTGSLLKPRVNPEVSTGFAGLSLSGAF